MGTGERSEEKRPASPRRSAGLGVFANTHFMGSKPIPKNSRRGCQYVVSQYGTLVFCGSCKLKLEPHHRRRRQAQDGRPILDFELHAFGNNALSILKRIVSMNVYVRQHQALTGADLYARALVSRSGRARWYSRRSEPMSSHAEKPSRAFSRMTPVAHRDRNRLQAPKTPRASPARPSGRRTWRTHGPAGRNL